ncbi:hypothetical protein TRFO_39349 [Tritrichomonas foetus]|uniref:Uncharacterized protein n=1 Tax=Tritrichomonas foetus TaxID=1144522 RepID=A0A1J4JB15_9EUKA|nr:hypothetical protein TRFO_39349 [Tritrichomonas foetus]|eukprot:OHS94444.1 hypothetical protein TRFO_39349 [Tritrichomonas foetus]
MNDYSSLLPLRIPKNTTSGQNDLTIGLVSNDYQVSISNPGLNQKSMIPLITLDISNTMLDLHYDATEKKKNMILKPKFGNYPIALTIFPLKDMNFILSYRPSLELDEGDVTKFVIDSKFNSLKKKGHLSIFSQNKYNHFTFSFGGDVSFISSLSKSINTLYGFIVSARRGPISTGFSINANAETHDEILKFVSRFDNKNVDARFFVLKSRLEGYTYKWSLLLNTPFLNTSSIVGNKFLNNSNNRFHNSFNGNGNYSASLGIHGKKHNDNFVGVYSLKISAFNKILEINTDSQLKMKITAKAPLGCDAYVSASVSSNFKLYDKPPLISVNLTFDKTK